MGDPSASRRIFKIKITLTGVKPPVWRRVLVPSDETLDDLHRIVQISMGWGFSHLHEFKVGDRIYGEPNRAYQDVKVLPDWNIKLSTIFRRGIRDFTYLYDFGDYWMHKIAIENVQPFDHNESYPLLVTGRRNCPPEDVGGDSGYFEFLKAMKDPLNIESAFYVDWYEGEFDPEEFDQGKIQKRLTDWASNRFRSDALLS